MVVAAAVPDDRNRPVEAVARQTREGVSSALTRGFAWLLSMRMTMRVLGLASTAVIARLLTPEDFGIFALAIAATGIINTISNLSSDSAIIREKNPEVSFYNTAWTINLVAGACAAFAILGLTPFLVYAYEEPLYWSILPALAAGRLLKGLATPATADFRKYLQFGREVQYVFTAHVLSVCAGVLGALVFRNFWALVIGAVVRHFAEAVLSFLMTRHRPRLSLAERSRLIGFSGWSSLKNVCIHLLGHGDKLIAGAFYTAREVGFYAVGSSLAALLVTEFLHPLGRALLPGLAAVQSDENWMSRTFPTVLNVTTTISIALGAGVALVAEELVLLVYGERYEPAAILTSMFAGQMALLGITFPIGQYLTVDRKESVLASFYLFQVIMALTLFTLVGLLGSSIVGYAAVKYVVFALALLRFTYLVPRLTPSARKRSLGAVFRPIASGLIMAGVVVAVSTSVTLDSVVGVLALKVVVGALTFAAVSLGGWILFGRPDGFEERALESARTIAHDLGVRVRGRMS